MYSWTDRDISFICGDDHKHYVVQIYKPREL